MKLWDLHVIDYDAWPHETLDCVVAAPDELEARRVASEACAGADAWFDAAQVSCRELIADEFIGPCLVVVSDYCKKCEDEANASTVVS